MTAPVRPLEREVGDLRPAPLWHRTVAASLKALIAVAILAGAAWGAREIMLNAPGAERTERPRLPRMVEVMTVEPATQGPHIEAWGEVVADRSLSLRPEVGGRIVWLNDRLTPGGRVAAGEALLRLDDRTLKLDLARAEANIREIEARIRIEAGQQSRARSDLDRVPTRLNDEQRALVLRKPQMDQLEAELAAAKAARDAVEVSLSKTVVTAPFDALVMSESVAPGATLAANAEAATLVAADAFRVELAVPVAALDWVDPDGGQTVRLTAPDSWPDGAWREGTVARLSPDLTATGRMAELILRVADPLAQGDAERGKPPLLLGSFLRADIEGRPVADAVALPRAYLRDGNRVWVMTDDDRLEIRPVAIAWRGADRVLVSHGLAAGERVITTHLATVADGMKLRLDGHGDSGDGDGSGQVARGADRAGGG